MNLIKEVIDKLKDIYEYFKFGAIENDSYNNEEFSKIFGDAQINEPLHCNDVSNIDLVLNNMFKINDEIIAIDYEWCFDFPIPIEYIFWRTIYYELIQNLLFKEFFTMEEIFDELHLNKDWIKVFIDWEIHFGTYVNGPKLPKQHIVSGTKLVKESRKNKMLVQEKNKEIKALKKKVKKLKKDNSKLKSKVKLMESSTSWKITSPLRNMKKKMK